HAHRFRGCSRSIAAPGDADTSESSEPWRTGGTSRTLPLCPIELSVCARSRRTGQPNRERPDYFAYSPILLIPRESHVPSCLKSLTLTTFVELPPRAQHVTIRSTDSSNAAQPLEFRLEIAL